MRLSKPRQCFTSCRLKKKRRRWASASNTWPILNPTHISSTTSYFCSRVVPGVSSFSEMSARSRRMDSVTSKFLDPGGSEKSYEIGSPSFSDHANAQMTFFDWASLFRSIACSLRWSASARCSVACCSVKMGGI